jgi:hypothetical protein
MVERKPGRLGPILGPLVPRNCQRRFRPGWSKGQIDQIYLDQNKWIDLKRAKEHPHDGRYQPGHDILAIGLEGVRQGRLAFPLSIIHYMETSNRGDPESRHALADVMAELSSFRTIAPPGRQMLDMEIDMSLRSMFGRPLTVRQVPVFGQGVAHAAGEPELRFRYHPKPGLSEAERAAREEALRPVVELQVLYGADDPDRRIATDLLRQNGEAYAAWEEARRQLSLAEGHGRGDPLERLMMAEGLVEILDETNQALGRAGIPVGSLLELGAPGMTRFLRGVSTRWVVTRLRGAVRRNKSRAWEGNDLRDLAALSLAVVYCDVVVTERQWAAEIRRLRLDEEFDTFVTHRLVDLRDRLVLG